VLGRGKYCIESAICSGGFGIVYRAYDKSCAEFAIKEFYVEGLSYRAPDGSVVSPPSYAAEIAELQLLFSEEGWWPGLLSHPNILRVLDYFEENGTGYIVLEYIEGADLQDIMENHPGWLRPGQIVKIAGILGGGLHYLHMNGVVHGDVSPDNVIMRGVLDPVLIDFGSSLFSDEGGPVNRAPAKLRAVKDGYSPPELYDRYAFPTAASDIYSLGATLHHMVVGAAPESAEGNNGAGTAEPKLLRHVGLFDRRFLEMIAASLSPKQEMRPSAAQIANICNGIVEQNAPSSSRLQ